MLNPCRVRAGERATTVAARISAAVLCGTGLSWLPVPANAQDERDWTFRAAPYLWVATITGEFGADGAQGSTEDDYSFWALENLQRYGAFNFSARAERWGWFIDSLYVEYSDDFANAAFATSIEFAARVYEAGGDYRLRSVPGLAVLGGIRVVDADVTVALSPGPDGDAGERFADPFFGVRYRRPFGSGGWYLDLRADVGGFGVSAESERQLMALAGYRFSDRLEAFGGYRYLSGEFRERVELDLELEGPGIAFAYSW